MLSFILNLDVSFDILDLFLILEDDSVNVILLYG